MQMTRFKEYRIGDLFDIHPTKSYGLTNDKLFKSSGSTPVVVNSSLNNGIGGYVSLSPTEKGNTITFSDTTTADGIFYQPNDFVGYSHVQGLYPIKYEDKWNEKSLLYFLTLFKKQAKGRFDYGNKFTRQIASDMLVKIPVNENDEIDFQFMERYISELEEERISELEEERISELATYLKVSGLDNYKLSSYDNSVLKTVKNTREYRLDELFEIKSPSKRFNANAVKLLSEKEEGAFRYIVRSSQNNGQRGYIKADPKYLSPQNSIAFGQDTATVFYQNEPYFTGDKIKIMTLKNHELNEKVALYLLTKIRKAFITFSWGQTSFNENILKSMVINLPLDSSNKIDYKYMEEYINAQQKIAITDVAMWKDSIINATKVVVKE